MTTAKVLRDNEIYLDGKRFPIIGAVAPTVVSQFPGKVVTGDYTNDSNRVASSLVMSDHRGGMLIEDMDETVDIQRCWWSNCHLNWKEHMFLPPLISEATAPEDTVAPGDPTNNDMEDYTLSAESAAFTSAYDPDGSDSYHEIDDYDYRTYQYAIAVTTGRYYSQLTSVKLELTADNKISGEEQTEFLTYLKVYLTDYNHKPAGYVLYSSTLTYDEIKANTAFSFTDAYLDPNEEYAFVLSSSIGLQARDWVKWRTESDESVSGYACYSADSGATWSSPTETLTEEFIIYLKYAIVDDWNLTYGYYNLAYVSGSGSLAVYNEDATQSISWSNDFQGKTVSYSVWVYQTAANTGRIGLYDGVDTTYSSYPPVTNEWYKLIVAKTLDGSATELTISLCSETENSAYFDDVKDISSSGGYIKFCNFNDNLYMARGANLYKLNTSTGNTFTLVETFTADITDIFPGILDKMVILLGQDTAHQLMDTAENCAAGSTNKGIYGVTWYNKFFKIDEDNILYYTANNSDWTTRAQITGARTVRKLFLYRAADGEPVIYASCDDGLLAYDFDNNLWKETQLVYPEHDSTGKGVCVWRDNLYVSCGLDVFQYNSGATARISSVGLSEEAGLPDRYRGEIVDMFAGFNEMYALVDTSNAGGSSYSALMAYNESGWQCRWIDSSVGRPCSFGIVSNVYTYRVWFIVDKKIYYMPLNRSLHNPIQVPTSTYASSGTHIASWFDGGWQVGTKTAINLRISARNVSATETITVSYRLNHAYTDVPSGWTTLGTVNLAELPEGYGIAEFAFGSGYGIEFNAIQFKFEFARGSSNTATPDMQWYCLSYIKNMPLSWGWSFRVDCTEPYNGRNPSQIIDELIVIANKTVLVDFGFRDDTDGTQTYKVKVQGIDGELETGTQKEGAYRLFVSEVN